MSSDLDHITILDARLTAIVRDFTLLAPLSWPVAAQRQFLASMEKGNPTLPDISYPALQVETRIEALKKLIAAIGTGGHPALAFLKRNAESYLTGYYILQGAGTSAVTEHSRRLYGHPHDLLPGHAKKTFEVAQYFLRIAERYHVADVKAPQPYSAADMRDILINRICEVIDIRRDPIAITIQPDMPSRAAAGPNYVKLRQGTMFSDADVEQLLHHEVFTHTLTYINGRKQPLLTSLGYNAPRITATQEGLATFAEYIQFAIDLGRLKRIALRIIAIDMAVSGANLTDLFRFFQEHGQNPEESYFSAMRIFRGGTPKGGIIFFKDNVYLRGLIEIEAFFKKALHAGALHDMDVLFTGKLTTEDVETLHPLVDEGHIAEPAYLPKWMKQRDQLAAHLAFNDLTEVFNLR